MVDAAAGSGVYNMAVDEVLLESALDDGRCTLRWYRWREPTVSLGFFQPAEEVGPGARFDRLAKVRRLSGGGAILHHHELTYSCAIPPEHPLAKDPVQLYDAIHEAILGVLARHGVRADLRGSKLSGAEPFLCFGRGDPRDIVIGPHKILGSAQRRRRGGVLQHGSLLLRRSPHAPEFPGLFDLARVPATEEQLLCELAAAAPARLAAARSPAGLSPAEAVRAAALESDVAARLFRTATHPFDRFRRRDAL